MTPSFDDMYLGTPPWDIGRPQGMFVNLLKSGRIVGPVLDVGCGTGEQVLLCAANGLEAMGIDFSPRAIRKAKRKAKDRGLKATFRTHDALDLASLKRTFRTLLDNGLFHTFDDDERLRFAEQVAAVLEPGGTYFMACFSDKEPTDWGGPRRVSEEEIRGTFRPPTFRVRSIADARFETNHHGEEGGRAYLSDIERS